jgi:hypothetical protein
MHTKNCGYAANNTEMAGWFVGGLVFSHLANVGGLNPGPDKASAEVKAGLAELDARKARLCQTAE